MLTPEEVKHYLRVAGDEDDAFIEGIISAGNIYLKGAVDDFAKNYEQDEDFMKLSDTWVLTQWCPTMYDQREGMTQGGDNLGIVARAMLTQLQLYKPEEVE